MNNVFLSLGSNIGRRLDNINICIEKLLEKDITIIKQSSIYETYPINTSDSNLFYNMVLFVEVKYNLDIFFQVTKKIELDMGRVKNKPKNSPRIIDIDILTFSNLIVDKKELTIPHPRLHERKFVLEPWYEIDPYYTVPYYNELVSILLKNVKDASKVCKLDT